MPKILVAYASADGSTAEVASAVGRRLTSLGFVTDVVDIEFKPDPTPYDAVIVGSAIHNGALLPTAVAWVEARKPVLESRRTWLFTLGFGPVLRGPIGGIFRRMVPPDVASVQDALKAEEYRPFAGAFSRPPERRLRVLIWLLGASYGDHRDWAQITDWADSIARRLG
ncbi:flavodoxin domain-containing protein [Smaragdicoccus niigatensis]|uniref:flavodoxin domain-containing protein n=1 Tax=Smaragdicoccus niigatensis TaxID=359359 RepID=UPI000366944D|nr:flavodoxin domain-containing protein [Smaragdicoccus niigatensis]